MVAMKRRRRADEKKDVRVTLDYLDINSLVPYDWVRNSGKRKFYVDGDCFVWAGGRDRDGYGQICIEGKTTRVHRFVFEQLNGSIPIGMVVRHSCNNPACINPAHLSTGTHADNVADRQRALRQTRHAAHPKAILDATAVRRIRAMVGCRTQAQIGRMFGVSQSAISLIKLGRNWKGAA